MAISGTAYRSTNVTHDSSVTSVYIESVRFLSKTIRVALSQCPPGSPPQGGARLPRAAPLGAALDATSGRVFRECAGFLPWSACASGAGPEESRVFGITPATLMAIVICI